MNPLMWGGVGALAIIIALSGVVWVQHERLDAKEETIAALELSVDAWKAKVDEKTDALEMCVEVNNANKEEIERLQEWARIAEERQREIARLLSEKARAEADLRAIADAYRELREIAAPMSVCQTYQLALVHVAEGGTP